jgi:hypothetical protein
MERHGLLSQIRQTLGQLRPNDFPGHINFAADSLREGHQHLPARTLLYPEKRLAAIFFDAAYDA